MNDLDKALRKIISNRRECPEVQHTDCIDEHMVSQLSEYIRQREKELLDDLWQRTITIYKRGDEKNGHYNQVHELNKYIANKLKELSE